MDTRGDVIILGLWEQHNDTIIKIKHGDADADTYRFKPMDKLLDRWEKTNKDMHGKHCHKQQKDFSMFVLFVDGMLGKEVLFVFTDLS